MSNHKVSLIWASILMILPHACDASDNCLEREWVQLAEARTVSQRSFDEANDLNFEGFRYSCDAYTTPTEVEIFVQKLAESAKANDIERFADLVRFPIVVYEDETFENSEGFVEHKGVVYEGRDEFISAFSQGLPGEIRSVMSCLSLTNASINKTHGISAGFGSIWISRNSDSRTLFVQTLGFYTAAQEKWLALNCK